MTRALSFDRKIVSYNFLEVSVSRESNQYVIKRDNYSLLVTAVDYLEYGLENQALMKTNLR